MQQESLDNFMSFVGSANVGMFESLKETLSRQCALMMSSNCAKPLNKIPINKSQEKNGDDDGVENNAAELVGLDPLKKISSIEQLNLFNANICEPEILQIYVSIKRNHEIINEMNYIEVITYYRKAICNRTSKTFVFCQKVKMIEPNYFELFCIRLLI